MLICCRHGESEDNAAGLLVGRADPPLTERGMAQAEKIAVFLSRELSGGEVPQILSSPLERALTTATMISDRLGAGPVAVDERLVELDYGELDRRPVSSVTEEEWARWRADATWRPEGGESLVDVVERVTSFLEEVAPLAAESDVVVVSHVSPIKAAAGWALGVGPEVSWRLFLPVASVTRIVTGTPALFSFGETGHLAERP